MGPLLILQRTSQVMEHCGHLRVFGTNTLFQDLQRFDVFARKCAERDGADRGGGFSEFILKN